MRARPSDLIIHMQGDLLTIIVPVLNEAERLIPLVSHLNAQRCPVVVVDGGSSDQTHALLCRNVGSHIKVLQSGRGRGLQMNCGAGYANTPYLLFLHADTTLPADGASLAIDCLSESEPRWGRFDVKFDDDSMTLKTVALMMNWRSAVTGICTGDQAMFITADLFAAIRGFSEIPLMEDVDISKRLKRAGKPARLKVPVTTSARRWRINGPVRTIMTMWWLRFRYWLGTSPEALAERYNHAR